MAGGAQAGAALLDRGVTGIVCGSDVMALGVLRAARQRGLTVPRDLSVIGSDDSPLIEFTDPPLTTVRQPSMEMAAAACRALLDLIGGGTPADGGDAARPRAGGPRFRGPGARRPARGHPDPLRADPPADDPLEADPPAAATPSVGVPASVTVDA